MSYRVKRFFTAICIAVAGLCLASGFDSLEEKLRADISDRRLDDVTRIEAAFVLSGVRTRDSLDLCLNWYNEILQTIRDYRFDAFDRIGSANKVFQYLHSTWLRQYNLESTALLDIADRKQYNCVSATILYNLLCDDLGWTTEAFETPSHVYTVFRDFTDKVMVENTSAMGFDIIKNLQNYSRFLLQFYPENRALKIGLDKIYAYENSRGRSIDNTELLGLLAYNRAYFAERQGNFSSAYHLVLFAQQFNNDSRSNVDFEINLFYKWGKTLFQAAKFEDAFDVYSLGYKRYPDIGDFSSSARTAFINGLVSAWNHKNWDSNCRIVHAVSDYYFLQEKDRSHLKLLFQQWIHFFLDTNQKQNAREAEQLREALLEVKNNAKNE